MESIQDLTLKEIVIKQSDAISTFEKYGLDFCCKGNRTLKASCDEKKLNADDIENEIYRSGKTVNSNALVDCNELETDDLTAYIINVHHSYVKKHIPLITGLLHKVVVKHGENHPETKEINYCFEKMRSEIELHMRKEEEILFPLIVRMVEAKKSGNSFPPPPFRSIRNPINAMEMDHETVGDISKEIRKWSNNYVPPSDSCFSYQHLFHELENFERDLHRHIHLENNILFPKAIALESELLVH